MLNIRKVLTHGGKRVILPLRTQIWQVGCICIYSMRVAPALRSHRCLELPLDLPLDLPLELPLDLPPPPSQIHGCVDVQESISESVV